MSQMAYDIYTPRPMNNPFLMKRSELPDAIESMKEEIRCGRMPSMTTNSTMNSIPVLRTPCFYQLYPECRRQCQEATTAAETQMDASMDEAEQKSTLPTPNSLKRLRPRSPGPIRYFGLGSTATRTIDEAEFHESLMTRIPHIAAHMNGTISASIDTALGATTSPTTPEPPSSPAASVHHLSTRFSKPVNDMGDYLSVLRTNSYLRNPYVDPLDDPNVIAHLAHQHSAMVAAKALSDRREGLDLAPLPIGSSPARPMRRSPSLSPARNATSSPLSPSLPQSPQPHLTVDEADDLPTDPYDSVLSDSPLQRLRRRRRLSRLGSRFGKAKPSLDEFLAGRNGTASTNSTNVAPATPSEEKARVKSEQSPIPIRNTYEVANGTTRAASSTALDDQPPISVLLESFLSRPPPTPIVASSESMMDIDSGSVASTSPSSSIGTILMILHDLDNSLGLKPMEIQLQNASDANLYFCQARVWWIKQVSEIKATARNMQLDQQPINTPRSMPMQEEKSGNHSSTSATSLASSSAAASTSLHFHSSVRETYKSAFNVWRKECTRLIKLNSLPYCGRFSDTEWRDIIETAELDL